MILRTGSAIPYKMISDVFINDLFRLCEIPVYMWGGLGNMKFWHLCYECNCKIEDFEKQKQAMKKKRK